MWYVIPNDELYHHGILGQKWGIRRFQNPDGTLTAEGRKRYGNEGTKASSSNKKEKGRSNASSKEKKKLTAKQKKTIAAIGIAATATALATIGGYALYKSGKLDPVIGKVFDFHTGTNTFAGLKEKGKKAVDAIKSSWVIKGRDAKILDDAKEMKIDDLQDKVKRLNLENAYVKAKRAQNPDQRKTQIDNLRKILTSTSGLVIGFEGVKGLINKKKNDSNSTQDLSKMTDQELRNLINRANLEYQYNNIQSNKSTSTKSKTKTAKDLIEAAQKVANVAAGIDQAVYELKKKKEDKEDD